MRRRVLHIATTPCAGSPGMISSILNRYSYWDSKIFVARTKLSAGDFSIDYPETIPRNKLMSEIKRADLIHLHNDDPSNYEVNGKKFLIQLHSEPKRKSSLVQKYPDNCVTIAQKHAVLYESLPFVPNMIPIYDNLYLPSKKPREGGPVTIVYAPTSLVELTNYENTCAGKGYRKTRRILNFLAREFREKIRIMIFTGERKQVVLKAKTLSDIVIDECVTGGYHLSALEGLATGNVVVGNIAEPVKRILYKVIGNEGELPWVMSNLEDLMDTLRKLIRLKLKKPGEFENLRQKGVNWINGNWRPEKLVKFYTSLYDEKIGGRLDPWSNLKVSFNLPLIQENRKRVRSQYLVKEPEKEMSPDLLENRHPRQGALIVGSGPSINKINLNKFILDYNPLIFNCNYFHKLNLPSRPDYWFCIDSTCMFECLTQVPQKTWLIIQPPGSYFPIRQRRTWVVDFKDGFDRFFNFDFELERPCTVATAMTLSAMYMGCDPIYIIGVDLSFTKSDKNYAYSGNYYNQKFRPFTHNYHHIINEFKLMREEAKRLRINIYNMDPTPTNFDIFPIIGKRFLC